MRAVESVWDYPRPPRLERTLDELRVEHHGTVVAATNRAWRILETSHPPVFYLPPEDVCLDLLVKSPRRASFCEFKGLAQYWTLRLEADGRRIEVPDVAWSYPAPTPSYAPIKNHLAFYASKVDACWVDGERVEAQPGDFYGGWITRWVTGPFKGGPGTLGW